MDKDLIFICQHKKACGEEKAKKMLEDVKKSYKSDENHTKVYIDVYGAEVHVNGPVAVCVKKPETLAEKVARFEALAERVAHNRMIVQQVINDTLNEDDEDVLGDDVDDTEEIDDFGESYRVPADDFFRDKNVIAKPKDVAKGDSDDVGDQPQVIEGDEPSKTADPAKPSDMPSQE